MSKQDTVVFRRSRWRSLPFLAVSAATTWVFAEIAVLAAGAGAGGVIALGIFVAPCLCLLVWATLFWAREVLAPHGRVWIAEDGVGQAGAFQTLVVPWSQIAEIAVTGPALGAKYVSITVRDARCLGRKTARALALLQSRRPLGLLLRGWLAVMTLLGTGPFGAKDVYDAATLDLPPTRWDVSVTAFPISSRRLAALLQERHRLYLAADCTPATARVAAPAERIH
jgi:hypothetical protein